MQMCSSTSRTPTPAWATTGASGGSCTSSSTRRRCGCTSAVSRELHPYQRLVAWTPAVTHLTPIVHLYQASWRHQAVATPPPCGHEVFSQHGRALLCSWLALTLLARCRSAGSASCVRVRPAVYDGRTILDSIAALALAAFGCDACPAAQEVRDPQRAGVGSAQGRLLADGQRLGRQLPHTSRRGEPPSTRTEAWR